QQAHAELGLELADASRQARLGNAERPFSRGEAAVVDDHGEVIEIVQILHRTDSNGTLGVYWTILSPSRQHWWRQSRPSATPIAPHGTIRLVVVPGSHPGPGWTSATQAMVPTPPM